MFYFFLSSFNIWHRNMNYISTVLFLSRVTPGFWAQLAHQLFKFHLSPNLLSHSWLEILNQELLSISILFGCISEAGSKRKNESGCETCSMFWKANISQEAKCFTFFNSYSIFFDLRCHNFLCCFLQSWNVTSQLSELASGRDGTEA